MIQKLKQYAPHLALFAGGVVVGLVLATTEMGAKAVGAIAQTRTKVGV